MVVIVPEAHRFKITLGFDNPPSLQQNTGQEPKMRVNSKYLREIVIISVIKP